MFIPFLFMTMAWCSRTVRINPYQSTRTLKCPQIKLHDVLDSLYKHSRINQSWGENR